MPLDSSVMSYSLFSENILTNLFINIIVAIALALIFVYILFASSNLIKAFFTYHKEKNMMISNILSRFRYTLLISVPFTIIFYISLLETYNRHNSKIQ
jgi:hypothetical protein